jgi:site-specific DNA-cytosine methylase
MDSQTIKKPYEQVTNTELWKVHCIWKICLRLVDETELDTPTIKGMFDGATGTDIEELIKLGEELDFFQSNGTHVTLTNSGNKLSQLTHWRHYDFGKHSSATGLDYTHFVTPLAKNSAKRRPKIIDLFCGGGGLGLGFEKAGFQIAVAIDIDKEACQAHKKNFPDCEIIEGDIDNYAKEPVNLLCKPYGLETTEIDGIIGGPPCQGFSYIGERVTGDERNLLTHRFVDIVLGVKPKFFVMENVKGLLNSGKQPPIERSLANLGKNIGPEATKIVNNLPTVPKNIAKRDSQYRRRMVSGCIDELTVNLKENYPQLCLEEIWNVAAEVKTQLNAALVKTIHETYGHDKANSFTDKFLEVNSASIHLISFSIVFKNILDRKLIGGKNFVAVLRQWIEEEKFVECFLLPLKNTLNDYDTAPAPTYFKGVKIGPVLEHLLDRLDVDYEISAPAILNSGNYGAPQNRERVFIVGVRKDLEKVYQFPKPMYRLLKEPNKDPAGLPNGINCYEAITDLPDIDNYPHLAADDKLATNKLKQPCGTYSSLMRLVVMDPDDHSLPRKDWNPYQIDCNRRTLHADHALKRIMETAEGKEDKKSHRKRLDRTKASHTLRAGTREGKGSHTAVRPIHYEHHRVISVREGARLMGYPDWMTFHPTKWHGFRLVGNGVPAPLGQAVAKQIRKILEI